MWDKIVKWMEDGTKVVGGFLLIVIIACVVILIFPILVVGGILAMLVGVCLYFVDRSLPAKIKKVCKTNGGGK